MLPKTNKNVSFLHRYHMSWIHLNNISHDPQASILSALKSNILVKWSTIDEKENKNSGKEEITSHQTNKKTQKTKNNNNNKKKMVTGGGELNHLRATTSNTKKPKRPLHEKIIFQNSVNTQMLLYWARYLPRMRKLLRKSTKNQKFPTQGFAYHQGLP